MSMELYTDIMSLIETAEAGADDVLLRGFLERLGVELDHIIAETGYSASTVRTWLRTIRNDAGLALGRDGD